MADDFFTVERDGNALEGNVEVARGCQVHLAGFGISALFSRSTRKRMARDTVITVGREKSFFGCSVVAGGFGSASLFFPSLTPFIPCGRPKLAFDTRQFCEGFP